MLAFISVLCNFCNLLTLLLLLGWVAGGGILFCFWCHGFFTNLLKTCTLSLVYFAPPAPTPPQQRRQPLNQQAPLPRPRFMGPLFLSPLYVQTCAHAPSWAAANKAQRIRRAPECLQRRNGIPMIPMMLPAPASIIGIIRALPTCFIAFDT